MYCEIFMSDNDKCKNTIFLIPTNDDKGCKINSRLSTCTNNAK